MKVKILEFNIKEIVIVSIFLEKASSFTAIHGMVGPRVAYCCMKALTAVLVIYMPVQSNPCLADQHYSRYYIAAAQIASRSWFVCSSARLQLYGSIAGVGDRISGQID